MTPFATVTSVRMAPISRNLFTRRKVMEFLATGDDARLDDVHKVSWVERVSRGSGDKVYLSL